MSNKVQSEPPEQYQFPKHFMIKSFGFGVVVVLVAVISGLIATKITGQNVFYRVYYFVLTVYWIIVFAYCLTTLVRVLYKRRKYQRTKNEIRLYEVELPFFIEIKLDIEKLLSERVQ